MFERAFLKFHAKMLTKTYVFSFFVVWMKKSRQTVKGLTEILILDVHLMKWAWTIHLDATCFEISNAFHLEQRERFRCWSCKQINHWYSGIISNYHSAFCTRIYRHESHANFLCGPLRVTLLSQFFFILYPLWVVAHGRTKKAAQQKWETHERVLKISAQPKLQEHTEWMAHSQHQQRSL